MMADFDMLEVPEHEPGFWARLEQDLAGGSPRRALPGWIWAPLVAVVSLVIGLGPAGLLRGEPPATTTSPTATVPAPLSTEAPVTTAPAFPPPTITVQEDDVPAPWEDEPLSRSQVPSVVVDQWSGADNRTWCAAMFPESLIGLSGFRAAVFSGGWGVAVDTPDVRSTLGLAGTGIPAVEDVGDRWPHRIRFGDGTVFGWGGEGFDEANPRRLGELSIPGSACVYQLWSEQGDDALVTMAKSLRRVDGLDTGEVMVRGTLPVEQMGSAPWDASPITDPPGWVVALGEEVGGPMVWLTVEPLSPRTDFEIRRLNNTLGYAYDLPDGPGHDAFNRPCTDCGRGVVGFESLGAGGDPPADSAPGVRRLVWDDGSVAEIGYYLGWNELPPEVVQFYDQVTGKPLLPGYRATLWIADVGAFELWSHLGEEHLMSMILDLRLVG